MNRSVLAARALLATVTVALLVASSPAPSSAAASASLSAFGPRVGFSADPNQLLLGGQLVIGELAPSLTFNPNVDIGLGDNETVVAMNFDFHYQFATRGSAWMPYTGAGFGLNFVSIDEPFPLRDQSDTVVGGSFILGATAPTGSHDKFFGELKLGLGDVPSMKLLVGWNFPR